MARRGEGLIQQDAQQDGQDGGQQGEGQQYRGTGQTAPPQLPPPGETAHQVDAFAPLPVPEIVKEREQNQTQSHDPEPQQAPAEDHGVSARQKQPFRVQQKSPI